LAALVEGLGYRVEAAAGGRAGLLAAAALRPEVAIVGSRAPSWNGYGTGRALRSACGPDLFLVARVECEQTVDAERAFDAGFDAVFDGEADTASLRALLERALDDAAESDAVAVGSPP
jgi:CheY-like chemotaxis protein